MEAIEILKTRRSIREFTDRPVEKEKLEKMVDIARYAPTANNVQPWDFVAITEEEKIKKLEEWTDQGKVFPACIVVFVDDVKHQEKDAACASTYLLLAAKALGLGTCWINGYGKEYEEDVKKLLKAPDRKKLFSIITVGYPAEDPAPEKKSLDEILHWESF